MSAGLQAHAYNAGKSGCNLWTLCAHLLVKLVQYVLLLCFQLIFKVDLLLGHLAALMVELSQLQSYSHDCCWLCDLYGLQPFLKSSKHLADCLFEALMISTKVLHATLDFTSEALAGKICCMPLASCTQLTQLVTQLTKHRIWKPRVPMHQQTRTDITSGTPSFAVGCLGTPALMSTYFPVLLFLH